MNRILFLASAFLLVLQACVKTEVVPEVLQPTINIILPASPVILEGEKKQLTATYTDDQGKDQSSEIQWQSRNTAIATVNANGLVDAVAIGQVWIIAGADLAADSILLSVVQNLNNPAKVQITPLVSNLLIGDSMSLQAQVFDGNNVLLPNQPIVWSSSNPAVASIDANGWLRALSEGTTRISAVSGTISSPPLEVNVTSSSSVQSRTGTFVGNSGYMVKGTATLTKTGNDLKLVFGTDFQSSNGPLLVVYLAKNASGALTASNSLRLENLISTSGTQTYNVPTGTGLDDYGYAVVYCMPFTVRFGTATLN